jgi:hypothetical protein
MENHEYWMKVDNAGKVFHAVSNYSRSSTFRLSMYVNDDVDPSVLQNALNITLPRFESFRNANRLLHSQLHLERHKPPRSTKIRTSILRLKVSPVFSFSHPLLSILLTPNF